MEWLLDRKYLRDTYTIGKLYINNGYLCDTLEDKVRDLNKDGDLDDPGEEKVYAQTAIPYGRYKVILSMSPKFKKKLPRVLNVKHFDGILFHGGANASHSAGCILCGENKVVGGLVNSKPYVDKLIALLEFAETNNEEVWLTII